MGKWIILVLLFFWAHLAQGQTPDDLNFGMRLDYDSQEDTYTLGWWAASGETYFIKHSTDLKNWAYLPIIEPGIDDVIEWGFAVESSPFFVRLHVMEWDVADPFSADFDGDSVSNLDEILQGTSPFDNLDEDLNLLSDDWEVYHGISGLLLPSSEDTDGDGQSNATEFTHLTDPQKQDHPAIQLRPFFR